MADPRPAQEARIAPAVLPAEAAARLVEFARTCKAAARAVALYPAAHPAIGTSIARLAEASARLTEQGPCEIQVRAEDLQVGEAHLPKPDPATTELAALLHGQAIGTITLNAGADAASWRTLLLLLARPADEVRADGGIAHLWTTAGGPSIEIREVDYAEVLRERQGLAARFDTIIAAAMAGPSLALDDDNMRALLEIVEDPAKLQQLLAQLEAAVSMSADGVQVQTLPFLNMVRGLVEYVSQREPDGLEPLFQRLGEGARHLSVDNMIAVLAERSKPEAVAAGINVVSSLIEHMSDDSIAGFVADGVVAERGASERLAHAFRALVPDFDRQRQLLALARQQTEANLTPDDDEPFPELWNRVESMMTSYTDARYVSDDYARELLHARTQPLDVERTSDDPPERIAGWLSTVSDAALRQLDTALLRDLLTIEADPSRWRDLAATVAGHADDLVRVGHFEQAIGLVETIAEQGGAAGRGPHAAAAIERFGRGSLIKHLPACLREADDRLAARIAGVCHAVGQSIIVPLAETLAVEQDARARRRLREMLVGFGPKGAESISSLLNAANWEVRRTAAYLLREFGGVEGLRELIPLLSDAEPLVQREAVQVLVLHGSREASAILLTAVLGARGRVRDSLVKEILAMRDDRAAPLFAHALRELTPVQLPELSEAAIDVLGAAGGGADAVTALTTALHRGTWWAPLASRRFRRAAAQALARIGTPAALEALRDAAGRGRGGARSAARAALDQVG